MVRLADLVAQGIELAAAGDRGDLRRRLEQTRERLAEPTIRVIVVGEFKQGKSRLINALVGTPVCPVDDDIATAVPTVVRYGDPASARIVVPKEGSSEAEPVLERRPVELDGLAEEVSERGNPGNRRGLVAAEVFLPRKLLAGGLTLVDSPGVGGLDSAHSLTTLGALPMADAMLLVSDASQEYTEPEMQFLRQALRVCPTVAAVLTKTDLYPHWRQIADLDRGHLDRIQPGIPLFAVSSELRMQAARLSDRELNAESGFPELVTYLRSEVLGHAEALQRRAVAHDLVSVTEHLSLALQTELSALLHPSTTPQVVAELEAAKERTDELRRRTSRWQLTLNDGVADLISDLEHDLRDRMRAIQRDADAAIDEGDPGPAWDQLMEWLEQRVTAAVSDTFVWTDERARWLSEQVAEHFSQGEVPLPTLAAESIDSVLAPVESVPALDIGQPGAMQKVLIGMRGSYGGVLMVGLVTSIVGMSLINPFSLAAGLVLGRKAYKDDREARLKKRQSEAKSLIHKQLDEVIFQVGKQLRDRLRLVQRATRDHFTAIADEHHRSLGASVLAAQKSVNLYAAEREKRVRELRAELKKVEALRAQVPGEPAPAARTAAA
ncbi:dynamin family protein [Naasia sp. SYSU D00057]|uniref:dynamin family protein n=1 Tax=Naasia sp. SYSU D00057 TaxID=2817380 RepID=UPI001B30474C|nr:dynamin family protein [Naasia sp. SYSU D00057]